MFYAAIGIGIIVGFILRGNLRNLSNVKFRWLYLIFLSVGIEVVIRIMGKTGTLNIGMITFLSDLLMYALLSIFVFINRKDNFILLVGMGFLLNAIVIFSNGGAMPVSQSAMNAISSDFTPKQEGLYIVMNDHVKFKYLADIIYFKFLGPNIFSIGDVLSGIGMALIIIMGMKGKYNTSRIAHNKGRSSRKNRRIRRKRLKATTLS